VVFIAEDEAADVFSAYGCLGLTRSE